MDSLFFLSALIGIAVVVIWTVMNDGMNGAGPRKAEMNHPSADHNARWRGKSRFSPVQNRVRF